MRQSTDLKVLLYATKIRFPRYPPLLYLFYTFLLYLHLLKRKKRFQLRTIPDDAVLYILNKFSMNFTLDANHCVLIPANFTPLMDFCDYAKVQDESLKQHIILIFPFDIPADVVYISETLRHNFDRHNILEYVRLTPISPLSIKTADLVQVSLISSGQDISNNMCDVLLKSYFRNVRLVRKNTTIVINVRKYAPEFIFGNFKTNLIENVYFNCLKIQCGGNEDCSEEISYFCVKGETELRQCPHSQDYIPKRFKSFIPLKDSKVESCWINRCPYGLEDRLDALRKAAKPFLSHKDLKLKPVFLIQGNKGNAKRLLTRCLSEELGLNLYEISTADISAGSYSQTEIKIKNAFYKAKLCAPSVFVINNFENFGKNHEGRYNERTIDYFKLELSNKLTNNNPPLIVVCVSNSKEIPAELSRVFLEIFEFNSLDVEQRGNVLRWMLEKKNLTYDFDVKEVAEKTHGFLFGDMETLVYHAEMKRFKRNQDDVDNKKLRIDDFSAAIDIMQDRYREGLGAPKVPKVEWSDVGGLGDVKEEIIRTINLPLKCPELLMNSGLRRSGILLYGPPGTGKTLLAKAVATECNLCFLSVKGPELLNMYVGQSEHNIREVFERAREAAPCIIFFDELDSLAPNRGVSGDSGGVMDRVVSQLLAEMDGLNKEAIVFIIGATNRPDLIDPALLRPGRFDKLLYVGPAETHQAKVNVLRALTRKFHLDDDIDLDEIVRRCPKNISGADFYGICSNAWMSATRPIIEKIENGEINKDDVSDEDVVVNFGNFMDALKEVKPSISVQDMRYFERLKIELGSKK